MKGNSFLGPLTRHCLCWLCWPGKRRPELLQSLLLCFCEGLETSRGAEKAPADRSLGRGGVGKGWLEAPKDVVHLYFPLSLFFS